MMKTTVGYAPLGLISLVLLKCIAWQVGIKVDLLLLVELNFLG